MISFSSFALKELEEPFFISLRSNEINLRLGPGNEYPIKYTYKLKELPLKVLAEYGEWYKTVDKDGDEGWVNKNLTSKKRTLIVLNGIQNIYKKNNLNSKILFKVEENVILKYIHCDSTWCQININNKKGWVSIENVWGWDV